MNATTTGKVVFTGTSDWWQIVSQGEIEIGDGCWDANAERAAAIAEIDVDCEESWVARVTEVNERHTGLRVGDYACSSGIGDDVIFVRMNS